MTDGLLIDPYRFPGPTTVGAGVATASGGALAAAGWSQPTAGTGAATGTASAASANPVNATVLTQGADGTGQTGITPYTTAAVALTADRLYLLATYFQRDAADAPAALATQSGATWDIVQTGVCDASDARLTVFRCQPSSNVASAVIAVGASAAATHLRCLWTLLEITGAVDDSANNGLGAILDSAVIGDNAAGLNASPSLTGAGVSILAPDAKFGFFGVNGNSTVTPGASMTELSEDTVETTVLQSQWLPGDGSGTITASWSSSQQRQAIGIGVTTT